MQRTWRLDEAGTIAGLEYNDISRSIVIQKSGDLIAEVHGYAFVPAPDGGHMTGDVALYDRNMAMRWRMHYPDIAPESRITVQIPIAVSFSATTADDGIYVLLKEIAEGRTRGRLVKYSVAGDILWSHIVATDFNPRVLLTTRSGAIIVGGAFMPDSSSPLTQQMFLKQFFPGGLEGWDKTLTFAADGTEPTAIAEAITGDQFYVTGIITIDHHDGPTGLFAASFRTTTGAGIWSDLASLQLPADHVPTGQGDDLEAVADGVVVLGQVGGQRSLAAAKVVLIKFDQATGAIRWRINRDSDVRGPGHARRNNLAADGSDIYIAYKSSALTMVEKIRDELTMGVPVWSRTTWPDPVSDIYSLNYSIQSDKLYVGAQIGEQSQVHVLSTDNTYIASSELRDSKKITDLLVIREPDLTSHPDDPYVVLARGIIDSGGTNIFTERYLLMPVFPPYPYPFEQTGHVDSEILDEVAWRVEAYCNEQPCIDLTIEAHALQAGKVIWSKEFNKPVEIKLIGNGIPTTYGLQFKVDKAFQEVITMDESLFSSGIKGVNIQTDTKEKSFTVKTSTEGKSVSFVLSLLNEQGKTIKQYEMSAPDQKTIKDKPNERVSRLLIASSNPLEINAYPNPSSGEFTVTSTQKNVGTTVSVFNMNGNKIFEGVLTVDGKLSVKIASAKPGLYVLLVKSGAYERRQLIEIKY